MYEGRMSWNLDNAYLERTGGCTHTFGQNYTNAYWVYWRSDDGPSWRTLFRTSPGDHETAVLYEAKDLGFISNRNGGWRDTLYNILLGHWWFLVVTGAGDSLTSSTGTSSYYIGNEHHPPATL